MLRIREALRSGRPQIGPGLGDALRAAGPPAHYLDFETTNPAIPLYPGTRPYEVIPFQWSLHSDDGSGGLRHRELLADGAADPRREFAETLVAALGGDDAPVLVYSAFESTRLGELADRFPDLAPALAPHPRPALRSPPRRPPPPLPPGLRLLLLDQDRRPGARARPRLERPRRDRRGSRRLGRLRLPRGRPGPGRRARARCAPPCAATAPATRWRWRACTRRCARWLADREGHTFA